MIQPLDIEEEPARTPPSRHLLRTFGGFLRPYRTAFARMIVVEFVFVATMVASPHIAKRIIDHGIPARDLREVWILSGILAGLYLLAWILDFTQFRRNLHAGRRILDDIHRTLFRQAQFLSMSYCDRVRAGKIISRVDEDVAALEHPLVWGPMTLANGVFCLLLSGASMAWYSPKLCLVVAAFVPPFVLAGRVFRSKGITAHRRCRESLAVLDATLAEGIAGVQVTQAFTREERNGSFFSGLARQHAGLVRNAVLTWNLYSPFVRVLYVLATAAILLYGGRLVTEGEIEVGVLVAFILYLGMFFGPINDFSALANEVLHGRSAAERILGLLETTPQVKDLPGARRLPAIRGRVEFSHVLFRYRKEEVEPWVLRDVSFIAEPGRLVAFVGPTGAGKSTLVGLLCRFYEPDLGRILIDGLDIREHTVESLHAQMGIVLQDNFLFSGTVLENLRYARPEASREEIERLAAGLEVDEFIARLPEGYETRVGERGASLSQGERQLICFLRALVAKRMILVLDEATSSVDTATERKLQTALLKLAEGRTTFVVAHRLATVERADTIHVVEKGRIVESGTHAELLSARGRYASLYREYVRV
jgi:ABC-type multidrug transport system fused ATPase/permease subunit